MDAGARVSEEARPTRARDRRKSRPHASRLYLVSWIIGGHLVCWCLAILPFASTFGWHWDQVCKVPFLPLQFGFDAVLRASFGGILLCMGSSVLMVFLMVYAIVARRALGPCIACIVFYWIMASMICGIGV